MLGIARRYPELFVLFFYNSGVFIWLQMMGNALLDKIGRTGVGEEFLSRIPQPVQVWIGSNLESVSSFLQSSAWAWLIVSMCILAFIRFVKGLIKWTLIAIVIGIGAYLLWQNKELLNSIVI